MKKHFILLLTVMLVSQFAFSQTLSKTRFHNADLFSTVSGLIKVPDGSLTILSGGLFSINANHNLLWAKQFPELPDGTRPGAESFVRFSDGSYILAGFYSSRVLNPRTAITLMKTDASGNAIWSKIISDNRPCYAYCIIKTSDGGFALTGTVREVGGGYQVNDAYVMKFDFNANMQWVSIIGGEEVSDNGYSIVETSDHGFAVTGRTYINGTSDVFVAKVNKNGALLWSKYFGDEGYDHGNKIIETTDGGLAILGAHGNPAIRDDLFLIKLQNNGTFQWAKYYGGPDDDYAGSMLQNADGSYVITSKSYSFRTDFHSDIYSIKTDASGNILISRAVRGDGNVIFKNGTGYIVGGDDESIYPFDGLLVTMNKNLVTCNSRAVTTVVNTSTRNVDANFHKRKRPFNVVPASYTTAPRSVSVSTDCSRPLLNSQIKNEYNLDASVSPNPAKDKLNLKIDADEAVTASIKIINREGIVYRTQNLKLDKGTHFESINISSFPRGVYIVSIVTGMKKQSVAFIKE